MKKGREGIPCGRSMTSYLGVSSGSREKAQLFRQAHHPDPLMRSSCPKKQPPEGAR